MSSFFWLTHDEQVVEFEKLMSDTVAVTDVE